MFSSEIKETIYIAISLILAALVLGMVAFVMDIRSDFASVQNQEISARYQVSSYAEYDKYQGTILYGEDIIALIREYANTEIKVYIDQLVWTDSSKTNNYWVTRTKYLQDPHQYSFSTLEESQNTDKGVSRDATYFAYLVFDKYTDTEIQNAKYNDASSLDYSTVVGVKVICLNATKRCNEMEVKTQVENIMRG